MKLELARRNLAEAFARKVHEIAEREGLNGKSPEAYLELAHRCRNNMREMLQEVEAGAMLA